MHLGYDSHNFHLCDVDDLALPGTFMYVLCSSYGFLAGAAGSRLCITNALITYIRTATPFSFRQAFTSAMLTCP